MQLFTLNTSLYLHTLFCPHKLHFFDQLESLMLPLGHHIKVLLVDRLVLAARIDALDPRVLPVGVDFLARHIHFAVFEREQRAVLAEAHVQARMEAQRQLGGEQRTGRHRVAVLHLPAAMLGPWMARYVARAGAGLFAGTSNGFYIYVGERES